jgi:hypothetical protein
VRVAALRLVGAANTKIGVEKRGGGDKITAWRSRPFGRHRVGGRRSRFNASRKFTPTSIVCGTDDPDRGATP